MRDRCSCGRRAVTWRRRETSVSTWGRPEPVCWRHRDEVDELADRCLRGILAVDRAVRKRAA
jgi:hypothetical protein